MLTHLSIVHGLSTLLIPPFTLIAFTFGSCLCCANVSHLRDRWAVNIVKNINLQMVTHLSIVQAHSCLTLVIWPFTLTTLTFASCCYCTNVSHFKDGRAVNFVFFSQGDNRILNLNASVHYLHHTIRVIICLNCCPYCWLPIEKVPLLKVT